MLMTASTTSRTDRPKGALPNTALQSDGTRRSLRSLSRPPLSASIVIRIEHAQL